MILQLLLKILHERVVINMCGFVSNFFKYYEHKKYMSEVYKETNKAKNNLNSM